MGFGGLNKIKMFAMAGLSVLAVCVTGISTFAWFQINNSVSPSTSIQTNGVRTDAFVYNKNPNHSNDDAANMGITVDEGGTLPSDHSNESNATDFYILGGGGTFASMNWDDSKALQMYDNPNNSTDLASYFRLHLTGGTEFKIVKGSSKTYYGFDKLSTASAKYSDFEDDGGNIKCKSGVEGTYDVYMNSGYDIFIQEHSELTDDTQLGNMVGYYIVGSNTSKTNDVASTGAFQGGNFDFAHSYSLRTGNASYPKGAYYGLHLCVNDIFKVWDGRTRTGSAGWYGKEKLANADNPKYDGTNYCFVAETEGDTPNIKCVYEGYYDIFVGGESYNHKLIIQFHTETNSGTLTPRSKASSSGPMPKKVNKTGWYIAASGNGWSATGTQMYENGSHSAVYGNYTFANNEQFKITNGSWQNNGDYNYPSSNYVVNNGGHYDVLFDFVNATTGTITLQASHTATAGYYILGDEGGDITSAWDEAGSPYNSSSASFTGVHLVENQEIKGLYCNGGAHDTISWWSGSSNYKIPETGYYDISFTSSSISCTKQTAHGVANGYYINGSANSWDISTAIKLSDTVTDGNTAQKSGVSFTAGDEFQIWQVNNNFTGDKISTLGASYTFASVVSNNVKIGAGWSGTYGVYLKDSKVYLADQTQCTVTTNIVKDGSTTTTTTSVSRNGTFTLPSLTDYFDYTCTGWLQGGTGNPLSGSVTITANTSFTATYTQKTQTWYYFDLSAVYSAWGNPSVLYIHAWNSNNTALNPDADATAITTDVDSQHTNRFWKCQLRLGGGDQIVVYTGASKGTYTHQTGNISYSSGKNLCVISGSNDTYTGQWNTNNTDGKIKTINFYKKLGSSSPVAYGSTTYQVFKGRSFSLSTGPSIANLSGYQTPSTWREGSNDSTIGNTTRATNYTYSNVSDNIYLFAVYTTVDFYLFGYTGGGLTDASHSKWSTDTDGYISKAGSTLGTVTFSNIPLTAKDQIKLYSAANSSYLPKAGDNWPENTYAKQVGTGDNIEIRYTGRYNISATVSDTNVLTNFTIDAVSIEGSNFEVAGTTGSGTIQPNQSGKFVFTWSGITLKIGQQFAVETVASATDTIIHGAWGYEQSGTRTANYYYRGGASSVDGTKYKIGSVYHQTSVTITFTLNDNDVTITDGTISDYTCGDNTTDPTGIYIGYGASAPASLTAATNKVRMFYDSDTSLLYKNNQGSGSAYDKKASYSILTITSTVCVKIFHGLDDANTAITSVTNSAFYNSSGNQVYPATTSVTGVHQETGYFTLAAGSYVVTLIGKEGCSPSTNDSDYAVAVKHVTSASNTAEEHEVPIFAIGRGKPGSDLENGDYTYSKVTVGSNHYNRYIPFYAAANQNTLFNCYAKPQANTVGDGKRNLTLKEGDEFFFTDGIYTTPTAVSRGTGTSASEIDINSTTKKVTVKASGTYTISASSTNDTLKGATFTITKVTTSSSSQAGNDSSLQSSDSNPVAYSKQNGVRVLNSSGSKINFGGVYDSSLLDAGNPGASSAGYVSFYVELRHINESATGNIAASFANALPSGSSYRVAQKTSTGVNVTAIDDGDLSWSAWKTGTSIFGPTSLGKNTSKITVGGANVDTCFALSTLIEFKVPVASFYVAGERTTCSFNFTINITFTETFGA